MNFVPIWSYDNYVPAHLAMGRLQQEGITCWLKDENTVTIDPLLSNAVGGIKLMVAEDQAKEAFALLRQLEQDHRHSYRCPHCKSPNIQAIEPPADDISIVSAIKRFFLGKDAREEDMKYHCLNCQQDFKDPGFDSDEAVDGSEFPS